MARSREENIALFGYYAGEFMTLASAGGTLLLIVEAMRDLNTLPLPIVVGIGVLGILSKDYSSKILDSKGWVVPKWNEILQHPYKPSSNNLQARRRNG